MGPCRGLRAKFNGVIEEANGADCGGDESGGDPRSDAAGLRCHTILARGNGMEEQAITQKGSK